MKRSTRALRSAVECQLLESRKLLSTTLSSGVAFSFVDSSGDAVQALYRGPGTAEVTLSNDTSGDISQVSINGSTIASTLLIKQKTGTTSVGSIEVHGALKSITALSADLSGDMTIDQTLDSLKFANTSGNRHITISGADRPLSVVCGVADNLLLESAGVIKSITAKRWVSDDPASTGIQAASIGKLSITGAPKLSIAGDFAADLTTTATDGSVFSTAAIAGNLTGEWTVSGKTGSIAVKGNSQSWDLKISGDVAAVNVRGAWNDSTIDISGKAGIIKLNTPLSVQPSAGASSVKVDGKAVVKSSNETMKFTGGQLFASQALPYNYTALQGYQVSGQSWSYDTKWKSGTDSGATTATVTLNNASFDGDGNGSANVVTSIEGTNVSLDYTANSNGVYVTAMSNALDAGSISVNIDNLQVTPTQIGARGTFAASTTMSGTFSAGNGIEGTISGKAKSSFVTLGHEQVVTPAGTFIALRATLTITISGKISVDYNGKTYLVDYTARRRDAMWVVPNVGLVKANTGLFTGVSVPGQGGLGISMNAAMLLSSYTPVNT